MFDNFVVPNLLPAAPEIFLAVMALAILMIDLLVKDSRRTVTFVLTQLALIGCAVIQFATSTGEITYTFSNMFVDDLMSDLLKLFLYATLIIVMFYSRGYVIDRESMNKGEYYVLALFATLGMMVMISANHFLTIYIGLELLSLSLYAMVAMNRDSVKSTEAAMKYFVLGALASGLLLYGMSMIYGATGTLEITGIAERLYGGGVNKSVMVFGLVFLVAGLAFKLGVVPFHMWIPDVYHGAPTSVTLLIGSAPKLAAFAIVMRLLVNGLITMAADWQNMLIILSVLSMAIGNLAAIAQTNLKRMLAYSAISHMGFMLLGIVTGVVSGDARYALNAYSSAMFYVIAYVLMSAGTFGMILLMARSGFEAEEIDDFKGLNKRSPWFAGIMLMLMFSMAGVPFFIGFFAKFSVLQAVVAAGHIWLAIVAVLFSLIGTFYYLRVVKVMYFDAPADDTPFAAPLDMRILISANGLAVAFLGIFPQVIMSLCAYALLRSL
ncbi:MAG: NADH-quinone oxidoreductase subunit NuoN [Gammaproteobacteria bacterium]|nr:NADH-quinone oxidoreductase subunit NuoN [Gammaproteobacteria bacterium]MBU1603383.1 NADH-quinone oxidoreductase subunit NuoN [Gammaproteobacteria bacterium]MBU2432903.1 NADH-quinone oxidoreductase subunit NuoN [Gammaproteobacteria bacterium]MBU2450146.1 NADH-quinone oxidoreductase subunit NuoN [Gammaproteobacteria bacterium]